MVDGGAVEEVGGGAEEAVSVGLCWDYSEGVEPEEGGRVGGVGGGV